MVLFRKSHKPLDELSMRYHLDQWTTPKTSTIAFIDFLKSFVPFCNSIVDLGCGGGAATYLIAKSNPTSRVIGIDSDYSLIQFAKKMANSELENLDFYRGDLLKLKRIDNIDLVVSIHTLMLFQDCQRPLEEISSKLRPKWIALFSLFYNGEISVVAKITQHLRRTDYYSTFSIQELSRVIAKLGYKLSQIQDFEIPIDIPRPKSPDYMQTYTVPIIEGNTESRLQISGPMLLDWKMILLEKIES